MQIGCRRASYVPVYPPSLQVRRSDCFGIAYWACCKGENVRLTDDEAHTTTRGTASEAEIKGSMQFTSTYYMQNPYHSVVYHHRPCKLRNHMSSDSLGQSPSEHRKNSVVRAGKTWPGEPVYIGSLRVMPHSPAPRTLPKLLAIFPCHFREQG